MEFLSIVERIQKELGEEVILNTEVEDQPSSISLAPKNLIKVMNFLFQDEQLFFDHLACLTGLDDGPEADQLMVVYNLYSIPFDHHLMIKVATSRSHPLAIPSVSSIWSGANWHEREAFDLLGIPFENHPDLRRILLPADWEGHPLRKDYVEQEKYHGIRVAYDEGTQGPGPQLLMKEQKKQ